MAGDAWNIDAGSLRQLVTIETGEPAAATALGTVGVSWPSDADGKPTGQGSVATARCMIDTLSGRKLELARQLVPTATHLVTMRYRPGLDPGKTSHAAKLNRLIYQGGSINAGRGVFNIGHVNDVEQMHVKLELTCTEKR